MVLDSHFFRFKTILDIDHSTIEPPQDNTNKMTVHPVKTQISLVIRPAWSESSLFAQWAAKDPWFLIRRMPWLIWVYAECTCHFFFFFHEAAKMVITIWQTSLGKQCRLRLDCSIEKIRQQSDQGLPFLQFHLHLLDALFYDKITLFKI